MIFDGKILHLMEYLMKKFLLFFKNHKLIIIIERNTAQKCNI